MAEQPARLAALLSRREKIAEQVRAVMPADLAGTVLVARGSSDHAATCGSYFIELATGRPVASTSPSLFTLYGARTDFRGYLMVAVSQSGKTPEIVEVVERARGLGARAIAITNDADSPLASAADIVVALEAGTERAVPATKTVTAQLVSFALIAQAVGDLGLDERAAGELPAQVAEVLADVSPPNALAEWLADADRFVTVARGFLYGAAQEVALKIEETTSKFTAAFSAADLRHGPIAIAANAPPVLVFAHPGPASDDVAAVVAELKLRGASPRIAGPVPGTAMSWAETAPEVLAPVLAVVRGQQLALALARRLGYDPDAPPGLNKVTLT
ncbi:MAG TPA: SIS domain-containing protein [Acidimicrobiales bacterium]|nr:SIS domain-containing protein [Acidimicrobiales bacterium]